MSRLKFAVTYFHTEHNKSNNLEKNTTVKKTANKEESIEDISKQVVTDTVDKVCRLLDKNTGPSLTKPMYGIYTGKCGT